MKPSPSHLSTVRERGKHALRIAVSVIAILFYAPILVWAELEMFGVELQRLFDWITFRCFECSAQRQIASLLYVGVLALTLPVLAYGLYMWIRRSRRADRQVAEATQYLRTASERIPPASVGIDPVEKRFYRDRQGRLRPLEHLDEEP